jgi:hypothetical protein
MTRNTASQIFGKKDLRHRAICAIIRPEVHKFLLPSTVAKCSENHDHHVDHGEHGDQLNALRASGIARNFP